MKIVALDGLPENPGDLRWDALSGLGELTVYDRTPDDDGEILRRIGGAEAVFTNKVPLRKEVLEACPALRFISVMATGYNVVDIGAAARLGIPVSNVPAYGTAAVAQTAIALLLEICHHVGHHDRAVHEGRWESCPDYSFWDYPLIELDGKTMGILGFGRIGQATGRIARALGMRVLACGSRETPEGRAIAEYVELDTLLAESDVICLHCPQLPETEKIINADTIAKMKDGVILINNSRGGLIDEPALREALDRGKVLAAGLDVVSAEPIRGDNPLLGAKNCLITPHLSWAPREARQRIMDISAENLRAFQAGRPINVVNGIGKEKE